MEYFEFLIIIVRKQFGTKQLDHNSLDSIYSDFEDCMYIFEMVDSLFVIFHAQLFVL